MMQGISPPEKALINRRLLRGRDLNTKPFAPKRGAKKGGSGWGANWGSKRVKR